MKPHKPVKSFKHKEVKRAHIPSAEEAGYESGNPKVKEAGAVELPLNPVITRGQDPELFWMHKYGSDEKLTAQLDELQAKLKAGDTAGACTALENLRNLITHRYEQPEDESLQVDIRSLYRHEHIAPETLIKGLYRLVVEKAANQDELFAVNELFGNAIGHEELDKVSDYYTHSDGWTNRLIQGDSLLVMTSLLEREGMTGQVQCIYLDPPYGIKYGSNWQIKLNNRTVKDGDDDSLSGEPEQVKAFRDTWELGIHSYLSYLRERLLVARELLHESGSCFVQISDENVHLVRNLMDEVFGSENFVSQIAFQKTGGFAPRLLSNVYDHLVWYAKSKETVKYRKLYQERGKEMLDSGYNWIESEDGTRQRLNSKQLDGSEEIPLGRRFQSSILVSAGPSEIGSQPFEFEGVIYKPAPGTHWKTSAEGLKKLAEAGRLIAVKNTLAYIRYADDFPVTEFNNTWSDTVKSTFAAAKHYVVETNVKVVERCLLMTTDPGDLVLDPTCGSGTTAYVSEQWGRRWITTDTSRIAVNIAKSRLMTATFPYYQLYDQQNCDIRQGFIYKKVPHVMLGNIARGETPEEETLYDQPLEDKKRLRVIMGFAFESGITELSRSFGNFQVSIVRMHDDLLQLGLLKKDKKAASFVTIGEPDIRLICPISPPPGEGKWASVEIAGLDIYDPIKDEIKSRDVHDIAYWMVDDDYDGSNFIVRQVFFCGGDKDEFDEWKKGLSDLAKAATKKRAEQTLKLEIDDEAFSRIYGHKSHAFPVKKGQKIAVRVISQFGEETTKVLEVKS